MKKISNCLCALLALAAVTVHAGYGVPTDTVTVDKKTFHLVFPTAAQLKAGNPELSGGGATSYYGSGAPSSGLGVDGDRYINTANGDEYQKAAGSWGTPKVSFDLAGAAAAAQAAAIAASQPLDSDLTNIAALATTANGRSLLTANTLTAAGLGLTNGSNMDAWAAKTIYAGLLAITSGKTGTFGNTLTFSGTDGSTLNIGTGGTLGSNAFTSTSYQPLATILTTLAALANGSGYLNNNGSGTLSWGTPAGGGDFSSNTGTSVDGEIVLFSGTAGKTGKRATGSGLAKLTSGVLGTATAGTDYLTPTGSAASLTGFPTFNQNTTGSAATLTTGRTISITGDLSYTSASFNGSGNVTAAGTLATVNSNVGSFTNANITVNAKGLITAASNGTAGAGDVVAANQNALTYYPSITGTSLATGSQTAAIGKAYYTTLTSNLTVTSFTGTPVSNSEISFELNGCNGTATFTFPSSKRRGDADSATTTITPTAGNHIFQFKYNLATTTWYYTDTVTGPLNLAGGSTVVSGVLPSANGGAGTISGIMKANGSGTTSAATAGTDYYAPGSTDVAVADGGTGASTAAAARVNLNITTSAIGSTAIDWALARTYSKTLGANTTFTFSNATDGETIVVALTNTASNYTVTWPTVSWSGGTAPTQTVGAKTDIYTFVKVGSTIYGSAVQNF